VKTVTMSAWYRQLLEIEPSGGKLSDTSLKIKVHRRQRIMQHAEPPPGQPEVVGDSIASSWTILCGTNMASTSRVTRAAS
jgi:hypothetical protein